MDKPGSKIFLADQRGLNETGWFRSWNTFNFGQYQHEHKKPVGDILLLNDDTLAPDRSLTLMVEEACTILLLPVIGALAYKDNTGTAYLAAAGQTICVTAQAGLRYEVKNPFAEISVNFIQLWIKKDTADIAGELYTYDDVNTWINELVPAINNEAYGFGLYIGKFSGRGETIFTPQKQANTLFAFVLAGAFEVEGCLIHDRDGLALLHKTQADIEALSNDAIIILIEQPS